MSKLETTFDNKSKVSQLLINTCIYGCPEYWAAVKRCIKRGEGYKWHRMPISKARNLVDYAWFEIISRRGNKGIKTECDVYRSFLNDIGHNPLPWLK